MSALFTIIAVELRQRRWSVLCWSVALAGLAALVLSVYGSVQDETAQLAGALNNIPSTVKNLFSDTGDLTSPVGFLSSKLYYMTYPLMLSILGIGLAHSLLGREEQSHTLELLLARPVSRTKVLLAKGLAGLFILLIVSAAALAVTLAYAHGIGMPVATIHIINAMVMSLLISLVFSTMAFMLTAIGYGARAAATGISALIGLGGYIVVSLGQQVEWLNPVKILFPYHYYRPTDILNGHFTTPEALGMVIAIIGMAGISWLAFRRRDIE